MVFSRATSNKRQIPSGDEIEIFRKLGLDYIEPEMREGMGEVEAALNGELPNLITRRDLQGVMHVHSTYSDGTVSIEEMAAEARTHGYSYIVITDHSQSVTVAGGMKPAEVVKQRVEIDKLNKKAK